MMGVEDVKRIVVCYTWTLYDEDFRQSPFSFGRTRHTKK
jgi:hypothetical protein